MTYVQYSEPYAASRGDRFGATAGRTSPHRGQDTAPGGLPAVAVADGVFVGTRWSNALGNVVVIRHADGKYSGYAHLANTSGVVEGKAIGRGQGFGLIGSTGTAAKGRHLHYTIGNDTWGVISGHVEDPIAYINAHAGQPSAPPATPHDGWEYWEPTGELAKRVQRALKGMGRYSGPIDGAFGPNVRKGVQKTLNVSGMFKGLEDGLIASGGCLGIQKYAKTYGGYTGPLDRKLGPNSWTGFAVGLEKK